MSFIFYMYVLNIPYLYIYELDIPYFCMHVLNILYILYVWVKCPIFLYVCVKCPICFLCILNVPYVLYICVQFLIRVCEFILTFFPLFIFSISVTLEILILDLGEWGHDWLSSQEDTPIHLFVTRNYGLFTAQRHSLLLLFICYASWGISSFYYRQPSTLTKERERESLCTHKYAIYNIYIYIYRSNSGI